MLGVQIALARREQGHRGCASDRGTHRSREADLRTAERGEQLNLTEDEVAFYDVLEVNHTDETLRTIARELVATVRRNTTIDWTVVRENVRAHLRVLVKRILRKYGYPPDKQERATLTALEQAEVLSEELDHIMSLASVTSIRHWLD